MALDHIPAIPEPTTTPIPALLSACEAVVAWADQCDDIGTVREVYDRMAAVAEYLARQDHGKTAQSALRRLEVRIGELSGPAENHGPATMNHDTRLNPHSRMQFRKMAAHRDEVERVIDRSSDRDPPSRRKVMDAIKNLEDAALSELKEQRRKDDAEIDEFMARVNPPDFDKTENGRLVRTRGAFSRICGELIGLGKPDSVVKDLKSAGRGFELFHEEAAKAHRWLTEFLDSWEGE